MERLQYVIVGYKDIISKGNATVTIQGIGEYGRTRDIKFKIVPKKYDFKYKCH